MAVMVSGQEVMIPEAAGEAPYVNVEIEREDQRVEDVCVG
jgi:hypothetical protein